MSQASATVSLSPSVKGYTGVVPALSNAFLPCPQEKKNLFRQVSAFLQISYRSPVTVLLTTSAFGHLLPPVLSQNGCNDRNSVTEEPSFDVLKGVFLLVLFLSHAECGKCFFKRFFCERGFTVSSILSCSASQKFLENLATDMLMKCIWLFSSCLEEMRKQLFICERRKWSSSKYSNLCVPTWV